MAGEMTILTQSLIVASSSTFHQIGDLERWTWKIDEGKLCFLYLSFFAFVFVFFIFVFAFFAFVFVFFAFFFVFLTFAFVSEQMVTPNKLERLM